MHHERIIFLDIHGVLLDFVNPAGRLLGAPLPAIDDEVAQAELGKMLDTEKWWANLPRLPWGFTLLRCLREAFLPRGLQIIALTHPMHNAPRSLSGTRAALHDAGFHHNDVVFAVHKSLLAGPRRFLIDDRQDHVDRFCDAGGNGFVWPAETNNWLECGRCPATTTWIRYMEQIMQRLEHWSYEK